MCATNCACENLTELSSLFNQWSGGDDLQILKQNFTNIKNLMFKVNFTNINKFQFKGLDNFVYIRVLSMSTFLRL